MSEGTSYKSDQQYEFWVSRPVSLEGTPWKYYPRAAVKGPGSLIMQIIEQEGADAIRDSREI